MKFAVKIILIGISGAFFTGAALAARNPESTASPTPSPQKMMVNIKAGSVTTDQWSEKFIDCSDDNYNCISVPNRLVLAFPKKCSLITASIEMPPTRMAGSMRVIAPTPHYGLPAGSYILEALPNMALFYYPDRGLTEVRQVLASPYEADYDPNAYAARYRISTADRRPLFRCS